jgi:hypothetical protein
MGLNIKQIVYTFHILAKNSALEPNRLNRPVTGHIVSQSPLSHSICLLSSCGLKIKCSQVESAPMGV